MARSRRTTIHADRSPTKYRLDLRMCVDAACHARRAGHTRCDGLTRAARHQRSAASPTPTTAVRAFGYVRQSPDADGFDDAVDAVQVTMNGTMAALRARRRAVLPAHHSRPGQLGPAIVTLASVPASHAPHARKMEFAKITFNPSRYARTLGSCVKADDVAAPGWLRDRERLVGELVPVFLPDVAAGEQFVGRPGSARR